MSYTPQTGSNIIQNGDMLIDQRNAGASLTVTSGGTPFSADRWAPIFAASTSGAGSPSIIQQNASAGLDLFSKSLLWTMSGTPSTTTPAALSLQLNQTIEGSDVDDLAFGTAAAKAVTISGWLKSSVASANYGMTMGNSASNRVYAHMVTVTSAATWTFFSFVIPGDTTGTWLRGPGVVGARFKIAVAMGSTFWGTNDTWNASNIRSTSTQTQLTDTASATLEIAGIKMERGQVATPLISDPTEVSLTKYQRYYRKSFPLATAPAQSAGVAGALSIQNPIALGQPGVYVALNPPMYSSPTVVTYNPSAANANWRDVTAGSDIAVSVDPASAKSTTGFLIGTGATITTLADTIAIHYTADTGL